MGVRWVPERYTRNWLPAHIRRVDHGGEMRGREGSLYRMPVDHGQVMFPDDCFADLHTDSAQASRASA